MLEDSIPTSSLWASMNSWLTPTVLFLLLNLMIATIAFISNFSHHSKPNQNQNQNPQSPSLLHRLKSINFYASPPPQDSSLHHKQIPDSTATAAHYFFPPSSAAAPPQESQSPPPHLDFDQKSPPHFVSGAETGLKTAAHFDSGEKAPIFSDFEQKWPPHLVSGEEIALKKPAHFFSGGETGLKTPAHFDSGEKAPIFEDFEEAQEEKSMDDVYNHFIRSKSDTRPTAGEIPAKLPAKMRKSASVKSAFNHFEEKDVVEARRPATVREVKSAAAEDGGDGVDAKADDFINRFKQQLKLQRLDSIIRYKDMIGRGR